LLLLFYWLAIYIIVFLDLLSVHFLVTLNTAPFQVLSSGHYPPWKRNNFRIGLHFVGHSPLKICCCSWCPKINFTRHRCVHLGSPNPVRQKCSEIGPLPVVLLGLVKSFDFSEIVHLKGWFLLCAIKIAESHWKVSPYGLQYLNCALTNAWSDNREWSRSSYQKNLLFGKWCFDLVDKWLLLQPSTWHNSYQRQTPASLQVSLSCCCWAAVAFITTNYIREYVTIFWIVEVVFWLAPWWRRRIQLMATPQPRCICTQSVRGQLEFQLYVNQRRSAMSTT